jgi:hypothetical protein
MANPELPWALNYFGRRFNNGSQCLLSRMMLMDRDLVDFSGLRRLSESRK